MYADLRLVKGRQ